MEEMQYTITLEKEERWIAGNSGCLNCNDALCIYRKFCFHTARNHDIRLLPPKWKQTIKKLWSVKWVNVYLTAIKIWYNQAFINSNGHSPTFFIAFARFSAMIVFMRNVFMMWISVRIVMNMFIFVMVNFFSMLRMNMRNDRLWILMILTIFRRVNMRLMMFLQYMCTRSFHFIDSLVHYAEKLKPDCISTYTLSLFLPVHFLKIVFGKSAWLPWSIRRLNTPCFRS